MFWKIEALTAKRTEITQTLEGSMEDVQNQAMIYGLEILDISPDYMALIRNIFQGHKLSAAALALFFKDFADVQKGGLSITETMSTLDETTSNVVLKKALKKIS